MNKINKIFDDLILDLSNIDIKDNMLININEIFGGIKMNKFSKKIKYIAITIDIEINNE